MKVEESGNVLGRRDMLVSNKTRIVKLEHARGTRARRYCFYFDEEAEAKAQGLPYILIPRILSEQEWIEKYSPKQDGKSEPLTFIEGGSPSSRLPSVKA
jgi:hypothetical protein